jgi:hypothetical protein
MLLAAYDVVELGWTVASVPYTSPTRFVSHMVVLAPGVSLPIAEEHSVWHTSFNESISGRAWAMADQEQLKWLKRNKGSRKWNQWRKDHPEVTVDLSGADLTGAELGDADLTGAILTGTNLYGADLRGAHLTRADLRSAALFYALLSDACLACARLNSANLKGANLTNVDLTDADLTGARLEIRLDPDKDVRWPQWPRSDGETWRVMQAEASDPTTGAFRLRGMAISWPGVLVADGIVQNPNIPQDIAVWLARAFPVAFLANPVVPLWFVADPVWLNASDAAAILAALRVGGESAHVAKHSPALLSLLEYCAQR